MRDGKWAIVAIVCVALGGCHKEDAKSGGENAKPTEPKPPAAAAAAKPPPAAELAVPDLGVDQVRRFSYPYREGAAADTGSFISSEAGAILAAHDSDRLDKLATAAGAEVEAPDNKPIDATTALTSPDKASVAFATWVDPCAHDDAPSLYVASTEGKGFRHVLTGRSRFVARWVDNHTLVYEDPEGALRLYDVAAGRETLRLGDKGGLGLAFLSVSAAQPCNG